MECEELMEGEELMEDEELMEELMKEWILNLSMHFRDKSPREKFFLTYAETMALYLGLYGIGDMAVIERANGREFNSKRK